MKRHCIVVLPCGSRDSRQRFRLPLRLKGPFWRRSTEFFWTSGTSGWMNALSSRQTTRCGRSHPTRLCSGRTGHFKINAYFCEDMFSTYRLFPVGRWTRSRGGHCRWIWPRPERLSSRESLKKPGKQNINNHSTFSSPSNIIQVLNYSCAFPRLIFTFNSSIEHYYSCTFPRLLFTHTN